MNFKSNHNKTLLSFLIILALSPLVYSQSTESISKRALKPGRTIEAFYHHKLKKTILINGSFDPGPWHTKFLELWQWNNNGWELVSDDGPEVRNGFGWAFDSKRGKLVIYGGTVAQEPGNRKWFMDTWEWDGKNWQKIDTQENPGARFATGMTYDPVRKACVLFGGANDKFVLSNDTWTFDGSQWKRIFSNGPTSRWPAAMFYFPPTKKVYVYGGHSKISETQRGLMSDTWELREDGWLEIESSSIPGKQEGVEVVFNKYTNEILMVCGGSDTPNREPKFIGTTWAFNGRNWRVTDFTGMPPRGGQAMSYNPKTKSILLHGGFNIGGGTGLNDTWLLTNNSREWKCISGCYEEQKQWIENHPEDGNALLNFIATSFYTGKAEEIKKPITKAVQSNLLSDFTLKKIASYLMAIRQFNEGVMCLERVVISEPKGMNFYNLGCAYVIYGDKDKAFGALNKASELGYNKKSDYENDVDLATLRQDARWKVLLTKLK